MLDLITYGLQLTVYGMGLVFLMLAVLWALMFLMLRLDHPPETETPETTEALKPQPTTKPAKKGEPGPDLVAAITIAVLNHQAVRQKQAAPAMRTHRPGELPSRWTGSGRTRQNRNWNPKQE